MVVPKANIIGLDILSRSSQQKIKISFDSAADSATWIRAISDFAADMNFAPQKVVGNAAAAAGGKKGGNSNGAQRQQVEHVHADGTGNTTDELSALYGM